MAFKKQEDKLEKEPLYISPQVIEKFKEQMKVFHGDFYKLMEAFKAVKDRDGEWVVCKYEGGDPKKYETYLQKHGLVDFDIFFDFGLPINYFNILLRNSKL